MSDDVNVLDQLANDDTARAAFEADPRGWLAGVGMELPEGVAVHVHDDTPSVKHYVLPYEQEGFASADSSPVASVVRKAWDDEAFKQSLLAEPKAALATVGVDTLEGQEIRVLENSPSNLHIVLPPKADAELSDDDLEGVAGGFLKGGGGGQCEDGFANTMGQLSGLGQMAMMVPHPAGMAIGAVSMLGGMFAGNKSQEEVEAQQR